MVRKIADILLTVGVDTSLSYTEFQSGITSLVSKINSSSPKIKVEFDIDKSALDKLKTDISKLNASMSSSSKGNVGTSAMQGIASGAKAAQAQIENTASKLSAVNARLKEIQATNSTITSSYKSLSKTLGGSTATGQNATDLSAMKAKYIELETAVENLRNAKANATQEDIDSIYRLQSEMQSLMDATRQRIALEQQAAQVAQEAAKAEAAAAQETAQAQMTGVKSTSQGIAAIKKYNDTLAKCNKSLTSYSAAQHSSNNSSVDAYKNIAKATSELREVYDTFDKNDTVGNYNDLISKIGNVNTVLSASTQTIKENGDATQTLGQRIGGLASKFASWLSVSQVIMLAIQSVKKMVSASIELDTAMTELKKVTDETDYAYDQFLERASSRATELGASVSDIVTSTADFARLGYNIEDAEKLADAALVYKNVGDGIEDISDASESIISTLQAFYSDAENPADMAMSIVDKFNEVGNSYAISSEGVGEALLRSASAMEAAGNTLDETIALATAANTVIQDPDSVGKGYADVKSGYIG